METYMSVDEFLEKCYIALKRNSWKLGDYAVNWLYAKSSLSPEKFLEWYNQDFVNGEWSQEVKDLYSELKKAMVAGTTDAKNFLYTIRVITAFDSNENISKNELNNDVNVLLYAIKNGTIKNPENTYRLLQLMVNAVGRNNTTLKRELALHQLATPYDVSDWLSCYLKGPYSSGHYEPYTPMLATQFVGSVNDAKKKLNDLVAIIKDKINAELSKPVPNIDTIKYLGVSVIPSIANQIVTITAYFAEHNKDDQTKEDVARAKAVADELAREFDMHKILDVSNGNYVQQYATQAEFRVVETEKKYQAMKQDKEAAEASVKRANATARNEQLKANMYQGMLRVTEERNKEIASDIKKLGEQIIAIKQAVDTNGGLPIRRLRELEGLVNVLVNKLEDIKKTDETRAQQYNTQMAAQRNNFTQNGGYGSV